MGLHAIYCELTAVPCLLQTCATGNINLVPTDIRGLTFGRTPQQVRCNTAILAISNLHTCAMHRRMHAVATRLNHDHSSRYARMASSN
jgi:hypothetical protein